MGALPALYPGVTDAIGTGWSLTINPQTNVTQPTGTAATSDISTGERNETRIKARNPPSPAAKQFKPAVAVPLRHAAFKRY
ncbi:uncharacterized protein Z518_09489 [Rhinocladiella mackenziei CBS 650.93]|uniref:Uncharacterized protein n=1 Tax=Rhinocladiella mackenziei CBS 650.93 TaxID=1442369 RepID=A0A0D2FIB1_9EURO|nr:uncharacterized protein Z518_09489 [Rhinocladiella mackenziei CBS 650.93]KIX01762.1 hypothetical protein Z518_09489 [Rhinocladiella mackenziei CBS 650.93]